MVAKFLYDKKPKTSLKKCSTLFQILSNCIDLILFHLICQMSVKSSGIESERTVLSLEKEKECFCAVFNNSMKRAREIRKFHAQPCNDG